MSTSSALDPAVRIGHVHLKVANLDRALGFWRDVLGFAETQRYGKQAVFLSAGGYHHHIALNTWESEDGGPPPPGTTGLFHAASFIQPGPLWLMRSAVSTARAYASTVPRTMG